MKRKINEIVTLNISGKIITFKKETLLEPICGHSDHFFTKILSGNFEIETDENGCIYIEQNPEYASVILEYIRAGCVVEMMDWFSYTESQQNALSNTARFFGLNNLADALDSLDFWVPDHAKGVFIYKYTTAKKFGYIHAFPYKKEDVSTLLGAYNNMMDHISNWYNVENCLPNSKKKIKHTKLMVDDVFLNEGSINSTISYTLKKTSKLDGNSNRLIPTNVPSLKKDNYTCKVNCELMLHNYAPYDRVPNFLAIGLVEDSSPFSQNLGNVEISTQFSFASGLMMESNNYFFFHYTWNNNCTNWVETDTHGTGDGIINSKINSTPYVPIVNRIFEVTLSYEELNDTLLLYFNKQVVRKYIISKEFMNKNLKIVLYTAGSVSIETQN